MPFQRAHCCHRTGISRLLGSETATAPGVHRPISHRLARIRDSHRPRHQPPLQRTHCRHRTSHQRLCRLASETATAPGISHPFRPSAAAWDLGQLPRAGISHPFQLFRERDKQPAAAVLGSEAGSATAPSCQKHPFRERIAGTEPATLPFEHPAET